MLYIRRIFHQDVTHQMTADRDGSKLFFQYDYSDSPEDRRIDFKYVDFGNHPDQDGKHVDGILHPDSSESRINGSFKGYVFGTLKAEEQDFLLIWNSNDISKYTFTHVGKNDSMYSTLELLVGRKNHMLAQNDSISEDDNTVMITVLGPIRRNTNGEGMNRFVWEVVKYFEKEDHLVKMLQKGFLRFPDKYAWIGSCPVAHIENAEVNNYDCITLKEGHILSNNCGCESAQFLKFVDEFNAFYQGQYVIVIETVEGQEDRIYLKKICEDSLDTTILQDDNPTSFVWNCIGEFNQRHCITELFLSDYFNLVEGYYGGDYLTINSCYVAKEGEPADNTFDSITLPNGRIAHNDFYAKHYDVENFAVAVNDVYNGMYRVDIISNGTTPSYKLVLTNIAQDNYLPYLAALRTKPFMLLAGISGTGKSRIVRQMAKAAWKPGDAEYGKHHPSNFEMVQVKPNWHDSSELIGYVSRIGETPTFVAGDFLKFLAKAWENPEVPHFLCLDEMNLAPVEQYFAEYLSVIESRTLSEGGSISTDPIIAKDAEEWYWNLCCKLTGKEDLRTQFRDHGITIPQNLFVVGTVNMDETTYSFSRKVLDRAMTIEMNEVDLYGGLETNSKSEFNYVGGKIIMPDSVEGKDVYGTNKELCDEILSYLQKVNDKLEGTAFKIAYRTRNEFLVYGVNRKRLTADIPTWKILDEMTSMKILSRIEGERKKCSAPLEGIREELKLVIADADRKDSISLQKIEHMLEKPDYVSYWD